MGSVIAFSHSVHIEASRLLVERFYKELVAEQSIGEALEEARAHLHAVPARWLHLGPNAETINLQDWFIPQLYQVGGDPVLITGATETTPEVAETPRLSRASAEKRLHGFPPSPMYKFHGRAMELLELERAFRRYPSLVLSGMGGMGKTALAREAAAWWLRTGRFDAAIFHSFEQKAGAERIVQLIGETLGDDKFGSLSTEEQWSTAVGLFQKRRVLLVWDNFESTLPIYQRDEQQPTETGKEKQAEASGPTSAASGESPLSFGADARNQLMKLYRELTAGSPKGRLLVTCRPADTELQPIKEMQLKGLERADSLYLLTAVMDLKGIKVERPGYEREEIEKLLDKLEDHPLSVELVAPHLKELTPEEIRNEFGTLLRRFAEGSAHEARNSSLLASLEFSKKRLSEETQQVLPYLAWFEGGTFESNILAFTELKPEAWGSIRTELVATALVSVEEIEEFTTPYIRFHPTLPYAAHVSQVPDVEKAEQRFIAIYLAVREMAKDALFGDNPAAGMSLVSREEANLRSAINRAFRRSDRQEGWAMAGTLRVYLERAGRQRERDTLVEWVRVQMPKNGGLDEAACDALCQQAWSRATQGRANEALKMVQDLITLLETGELEDQSFVTFQLAASYTYLGRIYYNFLGRPDLALGPLKKAIADFEELGDSQRKNLSCALGDLANAYRWLDRFDEALNAAEKALAIDRQLGRHHGIAAGLTQIAQILMEQQRYSEADARYDEALNAAQTARDVDLQGTVVQHRGILQDNLGNYERAVELYKEALSFFQKAIDARAEMTTCVLLAITEQKQGHLDAAEAWYSRSRELALQVKDRYRLGTISQNVGILYRTRAEQTSDPKTRTALLHQAVASVQESHGVWQELSNKVNEALSRFQLGVLYMMLDELDQAEEQARLALEIHESLGLPDVYKDYNTMAGIARARGDTKAAAEWEAKRDAKLEELKRLRRGEGSDSEDKEVPEKLIKFILALAQDTFNARLTKKSLSPEAAEVVAQLAEQPLPLGAIGPFLQAIAAGESLPPVPGGLPPKITEILQALVDQLGEKGEGG